MTIIITTIATAIGMARVYIGGSISTMKPIITLMGADIFLIIGMTMTMAATTGMEEMEEAPIGMEADMGADTEEAIIKNHCINCSH